MISQILRGFTVSVKYRSIKYLVFVTDICNFGNRFIFNSKKLKYKRKRQSKTGPAFYNTK
jgi:hypothetical protein